VTSVLRKTQSGGKANRAPRRWGAGKKGDPNATGNFCYGIHSRHTKTELTKNWFHTSPFQHSYLSDTSKRLIFPRPIASCYLSQPLRNALWINSLSTFALISWQLWR